MKTRTAKTDVWGDVYGEDPGHLGLVLVAIMTAATKLQSERGKSDQFRLNMSRFFRYYMKLSQEFDDVLPMFAHRSSMEGYYSRICDSALSSALMLGLRVTNPLFRYLEIDEDSATMEAFLDRTMPKALAHKVGRRVEEIGRRLLEMSEEDEVEQTRQSEIQEKAFIERLERRLSAAGQ
jgi:hypothetical protein